MHRLKLFLIVGLFVLAGCGMDTAPPASTSTPDPLSSSELFYRAVQQDEDQLRMAGAMLAHLPTVRRWQESTPHIGHYLRKHLPALRGKTVYVLFQKHYTTDDAGREADPEGRKASQLNIERELDRLQPSLLGLESHYFDRFSDEALLDEVKKAEKDKAELYQVPSASVPNDFFPTFYDQFRAVAWAKQHPQCIAFGAEWRGLHVFHSFIGYEPMPPAVQAAFMPAARLRSWVMLARTSERMQQENLSEATIVVGFHHRADFERVAQLFEVRMVILDTRT